MEGAFPKRTSASPHAPKYQNNRVLSCKSSLSYSTPRLPTPTTPPCSFLLHPSCLGYCAALTALQTATRSDLHDPRRLVSTTGSTRAREYRTDERACGSISIPRRGIKGTIDSIDLNQRLILPFGYSYQLFGRGRGDTIYTLHLLSTHSDNPHSLNRLPRS